VRARMGNRVPFCPECRFEYVPGVKRCPDCGVALVEGLAAEQAAPTSQEYREAELCIVTGAIHARLLQDTLASQGIPSRLQSAWPFDTPYSVFHPPSVIGGGYDAVMKVIVRESDLRKACLIYADFEGKAADRTTAEPKRRRKRTV